jgi:hypothetical protein
MGLLESQSTQSSNGWSPTPSHYTYPHQKVAVYAPAEWADTLTLFHLYQYMYSVVRVHEEEEGC